MKQVHVEIRGLQPILLKSSRGVDPTDPLVKKMREITSKRKKTDADHLALDRIEFEVGLYWNGQFVFLPDVNIVGAIRAGATVNKRGREIQAGVALSLAGVRAVRARLAGVGRASVVSAVLPG